MGTDLYHSIARIGTPSFRTQTRRNRYPQIEKSMGSSPCAIQTSPHECGHDVHVRQQSSDLQHHDGFYALQGSLPRVVDDECAISQI